MRKQLVWYAVWYRMMGLMGNTVCYLKFIGIVPFCGDIKTAKQGYQKYLIGINLLTVHCIQSSSKGTKYIRESYILKLKQGIFLGHV